MDVATIIKLLDAGYSKEEIDGMIQPASDPEPEPEPAEVPQPAEAAADPAPQEEKPAKATAPASDPEITTPDYINALQKEIKALTAAIHQQNINSDDSSGRKTTQTDSDIIAKVIGG